LHAYFLLDAYSITTSEEVSHHSIAITRSAVVVDYIAVYSHVLIPPA